jgi:hypothetical protein
MKQIYSKSEVVQLLGIKPYQIDYALSIGRIPEPNRICGRRAFRWREIVALAEHFNVTLSTPCGENERNDNEQI